MMDKDLKWIKKHYGEEMMHMCRELFPKLLDSDGVLPHILDTHFAYNRHLAEDIKAENKQTEFKNYIFSFVDVEKQKVELENIKSASELLAEAGYILYPECKTEEEVQSFKKYYSKGEELCTFHGGRLDTCRVWFAVKKDVENIKREDFKQPSRQDNYGTSVISIQFSKHNSTLSIKNRYNHTVNNPDNTFNSDLDNIIPGLTEAFYRNFGVRDSLNRNQIFELDNYVQCADKYYRYNMEINNIYYCDNNIVIDDFEVKQLPNSTMLVDYFIVDFKNKQISTYDQYLGDSFINTIFNVKNIDNVDNVITITKKDNSPVEIKINDRRQIIAYTDENLSECGDDFLSYTENLTELNLPNLEKCGDRFLFNNENLDKINLPKLKHMEEKLLKRCKAISEDNINVQKF